MKRVIRVILAVVLVVGLGACDHVKPKPPAVDVTLNCGNGLHYAGPSEHATAMLALCDKIVEKDSSRIILQELFKARAAAK